MVYAALDVELLADLRDKMTPLLAESNKVEIAEQEFQAVLSKEAKPPRAEPWRKLSGLHTLRGQRNLAVARELWLARDALAQQIDVAPGRLVPDASLVAAARVSPPTRQALANLREFSGRATRTELDRWWNAISTGLTTTDLPDTRVNGDTLPPPRAWSERNPEADLRLKAARSAITELSETLAIPTENILTPDSLRRLCWAPPVDEGAESLSGALAELGARPWQVGATAQLIADAFVEARQTTPDETSPAS